jgi:hypothetical protein
MTTTDNAIFNAVLDKILSEKDRRLMMVTPVGSTCGVGMICFDKDAVDRLEKVRESIIAQLKAIDTTIMLSKLGIQMGATILED